MGFDCDGAVSQAFLWLEAIVIEQHGVIELARECLRRQRLDYAGKGVK